MTEIENFAEKLNSKYDIFKEEKLNKRRIKHKDILPLIDKATREKVFTSQLIGKSTEERNIYALKAGKGKTSVLLWSQMHGNEPTATQALFDIFNFLNKPGEFKTDAKQLLNTLDLHFIPMLNPDGAEVFKRRNGLNIDLNRDAARMTAPETQIFKKYRDTIKPDFGFNLHDQNPYYSVSNSHKPASITFLAPAFNSEKEVNEIRLNSMQTISLMNRVLQKFIPGQVGRYYFDDYGSTSMGDNMVKWGTRTILIESGEYDPFNDKERQHVRKMNFIALLSALKGISKNIYPNFKEDEYWQIPSIEDEKMFHILIRNAKIKTNGQNFKTDIGIHINEIPTDNAFKVHGEIYDLGDLTNYYAYREIDAKDALIKSLNGENLIPDKGDNADFMLEKNGKIVLKLENGKIIEIN